MYNKSDPNCRERSMRTSKHGEVLVQMQQIAERIEKKIHEEVFVEGSPKHLRLNHSDAQFSKQNPSELIISIKGNGRYVVRFPHLLTSKTKKEIEKLVTEMLQQDLAPKERRALQGSKSYAKPASQAFAPIPQLPSSIADASIYMLLTLLRQIVENTGKEIGPSQWEVANLISQMGQALTGTRPTSRDYPAYHKRLSNLRQLGILSVEKAGKNTWILIFHESTPEEEIHGIAAELTQAADRINRLKVGDIELLRDHLSPTALRTLKAIVR